VPVLGYETATEIAKEALATGRGVYDLVCDRGLMTRDDLDRVLDPRGMTGTYPVQGASAKPTGTGAARDGERAR
jgi:aspartate ammonia-lyase